MSTDSTAGRMRASDTEREQFAQIVRDATGDGRLSLGEGDERLAAIYAAKFRDELRPLVADLPAGAVEPNRPQPRAWGEGYPPRAWGDGSRWPSPPRGAFVAHFAVVTLISAALIGIWALSGTHFFWPAIPLIFFAMGLARHARWGFRGRYYYRNSNR